MSSHPGDIAVSENGSHFVVINGGFVLGQLYPPHIFIRHNDITNNAQQNRLHIIYLSRKSHNVQIPYHTILLQIAAVWDICLMYCENSEMALLDIPYMDGFGKDC